MSKVAANYAYQNFSNSYSKEIDKKSKQLQPIHNTQKAHAKSGKHQENKDTNVSESKLDMYA
jgi:hypothetical protein